MESEASEGNCYVNQQHHNLIIITPTSAAMNLVYVASGQGDIMFEGIFHHLISQHLFINLLLVAGGCWEWVRRELTLISKWMSDHRL